jgi:hypothetical protein
MPQLWLTFEEIADLFYCDTAGARSRMIANQWERRRCRDGLTRAQLPSTNRAASWPMNLMPCAVSSAKRRRINVRKILIATAGPAAAQSGDMNRFGCLLLSSKVVPRLSQSRGVALYGRSPSGLAE